jgi:hypothetical protein
LEEGKLKKDIFSHLKKLEILFLNNCKIIKAEKGIFKNNKKLKILDISNNELKNFSNAFEECYLLLKTLYIIDKKYDFDINYNSSRLTHLEYFFLKKLGNSLTTNKFFGRTIRKNNSINLIISNESRLIKPANEKYTEYTLDKLVKIKSNNYPIYIVKQKSNKYFINYKIFFHKSQSYSGGQGYGFTKHEKEYMDKNLCFLT